MRKLRLTKSGHNKLKSQHSELKVQDLEDSLRPVQPGEWCLLIPPVQGPEAWLAHVNPMVDEKFPCVQILDSGAVKELEDASPEAFIENKLKAAVSKRARFNGYASGFRAFYGGSDGLTGLIIDVFSNATIIQINSAGIDRYRDFIRSCSADLLGRKAYLLDNPRYREREHLPTFDSEPLPELIVSENGIDYALPAEVIQKVGFYYDHRENRRQLQELLRRMSRLPKNGVDLFCYAGSWGANALKAGVEKMDFVDQGDFEAVVLDAVRRNELPGKAEFFRGDVFKFLDEAVARGTRYELIICDPPAFAKSALQKSQALEGYSKLHRKVFKAAASGAICALSSCTHYVGHGEFQKNVLDAAHREGRSIQLLYAGMQGWDHPVESLEDRANYIKSYFYILE